MFTQSLWVVYCSQNVKKNCVLSAHNSKGGETPEYRKGFEAENHS